MEEKKTIEEFFEEAPAVDEQKAISRRNFLTGAVVGGAAGIAVAAGTGTAIWKVSEGELQAAQDAAAAELEAKKAAADAELEAAQSAADLELEAAVEAAAEEVAKMLGLLDLYEELDKIGLDGIMEKGLAAVALPLEAVEVGAGALNRGLEWAESALLSLAEALPSAQESLVWLETQVSAVASGIEKLQMAVASALGRATNNAVGAAVEEFTNKVLDNLPFGLGDSFRGALQGLVALVTSVDELVEGINTFLLEPLRDNWFSEEEDKGIGETFVTPLIEKVLDPLEAHLLNLSVLADNWQNDLVNPSQKALAERSQIREEIARYKDEYGIL
jgi:hypothetical protein